MGGHVGGMWGAQISQMAQIIKAKKKGIKSKTHIVESIELS